MAQSIEDVVRTPSRLCWTWVSIKARPLVSDNMDVFLETSTDQVVLAVFEKETGLTWGSSRAVGLSPAPAVLLSAATPKCERGRQAVRGVSDNGPSRNRSPCNGTGTAPESLR